jgi:hypothetical protein
MDSDPVLDHVTGEKKRKLYDDASQEAKKERKKAQNKAYKEKNADQIKAQNKAYKEKNADQIKAQNKAYNEKNADQIKAQNKAYNEKNADQIKAQWRAYKEKNADQIKAQNKAYNEKNADQIKAQNKAWDIEPVLDPISINGKRKVCDEGGIPQKRYKCEHNKMKSRCLDCGGKPHNKKCEHNKRKSLCLDCGGSGICEHNKRKSRCLDCRGTPEKQKKCEHKKQKSRCLDCGGNPQKRYRCEHNKKKSRCLDCGGTPEKHKKCEHNKQKSRCLDCGGTPQKHKKCLNCKTWIDARNGRSEYDGMCFRCYSEKFPEDPKVKNRGRVELRVREFLNSNFADFVHDHPIKTNHCVCDHRRRVDHRRLVGNTLLCIETDENFHKNYAKDDEDARYHDVIMTWGGKLCFVRFNPHKFNLDDSKDPGPPLEERLQRLYAEVTRHIGRLERGENMAYLEVHHLYYPADTPDLYETEHKPAWVDE